MIKRIYILAEWALITADWFYHQVGIFVAETEMGIQGIRVYFIQPFTFDLTPWLIVKELYVEHNPRSLGLGQMLMSAAAQRCLNIGGNKMKWEVLTQNQTAKHFYVQLGAQLCDDWQIMSLSSSSMRTLTEL